MISEHECITLYKQYGNMRCVIDHLGLTIEEMDFRQKTAESQIMIDEFGNTTIFVLPNLDEYHLEFLLAHELGHYVLHYDTNISFNYYYRIYKTKIEREANDFACRLLLSDIDTTDIYNLEFIEKEKGIPDKIWYSYLENIKNKI